MTKTALGGNCELLGNINFDKSGYNNLIDIIYHVVRCNLTHETSLPNDIEFRPNFNGIGMEEKKIILGDMFIWGLILSIIASPENKNESILNDKCYITFKSEKIDVNSLWGEEQKIRKLLK